MDHCEPCQAENPCYQCGCTESCDCVTPTYTSSGACGDQSTSTDCVVSNAETDTCVGIIKGTTILTSVINKIITYVKNTLNRLTPLDSSIVITPTDDTCDDKSQIRVNISNDEGNILELRNGLFVPTPTPFNLAANFCPVLESTFAGQEQNQVNTVNSTTYDFLSLKKTGTGCDAQLIAPPTGFAVTGNTRVSAFGKMEWFSTLAAANASAVAGETVLIYTDTTEILLIKNNVNYHGVGTHSVGNINTYSPNPSVNNLSNLILNDVVVNGNFTIEANNVTVLGTSSFIDNIKWTGGKFTGTDKFIFISQNSKIFNIYSKARVSVTENGHLSHSVIDDQSIADGTAAVSCNNTSGAGGTSTVTNNYVTSVNNIGIYVISRFANAVSLISNNTCKTNLSVALFIHNGGTTQTTSNVVHGNQAFNVGNSSTPAILIYDVAGINNTTQDAKPSITNNSGYSINGAGIQSILGSMKGCHGYSVNYKGIVVDSQENNSFNLNLIDCTGHSKFSNGLYAIRDVYIVGGTYISELETSFGNPILIGNNRQNDVLPHNYYIAGVKTIAKSSLAYGIKGEDPIIAKIMGCIFLNENVAGTVLGIHHTGVGGNITLSPVTVDAYMNIN